MTSEGAANLSARLGASSVQETFDIRLTSLSQKHTGVTMTLRVKAAPDEKADCLVARKNYSTVVVCDLLCLHRYSYIYNSITA